MIHERAIDSANDNASRHSFVSFYAATCDDRPAEVKSGEHFTHFLKHIRLTLIENGVASEIEALLAALIGVPGPATLSACPQ